MAEDLIQIVGYKMHREIGSGGMARVFLATQLSLGREVAIKVLRKDLAAGGEDFQKRFLHEGQMLAKLVHPNIVAIHDIGQNDEVSYMAMELLKGGTLSERIKEGLSVAEVIRITTQIAHALQLAHDNNIVHRDLKPSNIMFRDELTPVLTDFGIARKTDADHRLTKTGMVVGTPYYMSPEQITGRDIDGRSDIYSIGIMFYELLAGELPFRAEEPLALAMQHVQEPPPPLPEKVEELQPVMDRLLCKNPDDRYATMLEFCDDVRDVVMNEATFREKLSGETKLFASDQFSDPRMGTGGVRVPGRTGKSTATKARQAKAPAGGATAIMDTSGRRAAAPAGKKPSWVLPAGIAAVLVAALIGVYFAFFASPSDDLSKEQQAIVAALLNEARSYKDANRLVEPAGANAVATLQELLEISPNNAEAQALAEEVSLIVYGTAVRDRDKGDLKEALRKAELGLSITPEYADLVNLKSGIADRIAEQERQERLNQLVAQAKAHEDAGRLLEPEGENAYTAYQEILKLDTTNEQAIAGLQRIETKLVADARAALRQGSYEQAGQLAERAARLFPNSTSIASMRQEVEEAVRRQQEQAEIEQLLARAEQQFQNEQYLYPPGDNAVETYQTIQSWQPDHPKAAAGLQRIAEVHERLAREAYQAEDYAAAADYASRGLRAVAENQNLLVIQSEATSRLDAAARQVEQELQAAERLVRDGQYLAPNGGARAAYQRVLEMSPGNKRATEALQRLPEQILALATQLERDGNYASADKLLREAIGVYPDETRFASLREAVAQQLAEQQNRLALEQALADTQRLVNVRPVTRSSFGQAADGLQEILAKYPNEVRIRQQIGELTAALAEEANRLSEQGSHDAAIRLIEHGLGEFQNNDTLLTARTIVNNRQAEELEAEAARILAMTGTLAIDAKPWGEVVEIRDANGNVKELPSDATTPLVIPLLEGSYSVTVRGGNSGASRKIDVDVQRQQVVQTRAEFDSMTADAYFQKSGW